MEFLPHYHGLCCFQCLLQICGLHYFQASLRILWIGLCLGFLTSHVLS
jgi:hypothetical protein